MDPEDTPTPASEPEATTTPAETPTETPVEGQAPETPEEPKVYDEKYVESLRKEAAGYRTRLREAEERLATAKTAEEFEAAIGEVRSQNADLRRDLIAERYSLPGPLKAVLSGSTEEELEAHAKELAAFVTPPAVPSTREGGGVEGNGSGEEPLPTDPGELAARLRPRHYI